jgi:FAD/FMN-containing dehydrogenase
MPHLAAPPSPAAPDAVLASTDLGVRESFAQDASGLVLVPDAVARPRSAGEAVEMLRACAAAGTPVTVAGALTGYVGGAVTDRGTVLSLRGLDRVLDVAVAPGGRSGVIRAQAGALLGDVKRAAAEHGLLLAPDPTSEEECSVGGAVAANASGARSLKYGATRPHVRALTVALADGRVEEFRRPAMEKNTAGFLMAHDPVDWFVGSEGTLGVVLEAEFQLLPLPAAVVGLGVPFRTAAGALAFVAEARARRDAARGAEALGSAEEAARAADGSLNPRCLEYLDAPAFAIARAHVGGTWGEGAEAYVYAEEESFAGDAEPALDAWLELAERHGAMADDIQVFDGEAALRDARRMRHAVPATLNERAAPYRAAGGRKVSTDWAVPYPRLAEALGMAAETARAHGVEVAAVFGHAGNGHPHTHFVARDAAELARVEEAVDATLRRVLAMGGTVAAEHGIGKVKRRWLPLQLSAVQLDAMRALKRALDPQGLLGPGNLFP